MALITCPECGKKVSSLALACPDCGYPINQLSNIDNSEIVVDYTNVSEALFQLSKICENKNWNKVESIVDYISSEGKSIYKHIYNKINDISGNIKESMELFHIYYTLIYNSLDVDSISEAYFKQSQIKGYHYLSKQDLVNFPKYDMFADYISLLDVKKYIGNKFFAGSISNDMKFVFVLKDRLHEYEQLISSYVNYCDSLSNNFYEIKDKNQRHKISFLDISSVKKSTSRKVKEIDKSATEDALLSWQRRKNEFENCKRAELSKATFQRAAGMMLMDSHSSKPFSVTTGTMIGGAMGGVTGALVGASYSAQKNAQYQRSQQMNRDNQQYRDQANDNYRRAQSLQYQQFSEPKPGNIYKTITESDYEVVINSFVGRIAYIVPEKENYWIGKKKKTIAKMSPDDFSMNDKEILQSKYIKTWWILNDKPCDDITLQAIDYFSTNKDFSEYQTISAIVKSELAKKVNEINQNNIRNQLREKETLLDKLTIKKTELSKSIDHDTEVQKENTKIKLSNLEKEYDEYCGKLFYVKTVKEEQLTVLEKQYSDIEREHAQSRKTLFDEKSIIEETRKENTAIYEILRNEADVLRNKADKGGLFKKKKINEFEKKKKEADEAKENVDKSELQYSEIMSRINAERENYINIRDKCISQKENIESEINTLKDEIDSKKAEYDRAKKDCIDIIHAINEKYNKMSDLEEEINKTTEVIENCKRKLVELA